MSAMIRAALLLVGAEVRSYMTCGEGVALCGVLTLETGDGDHKYEHSQPSVHGLWPQVDQYGSSQCVTPQDSSDPTTVSGCYTVQGSAAEQLSFETHEWQKHGHCAGVKDAIDFFTQICALAEEPLKLMADVKTQGADAAAIQKAVSAKYPVVTMDGENEIQLSVCAKDGRWVIAAVADFPATCGGGVAPSPPSPTPPAPPSAGGCVHNVKGPKCSEDADCGGLSGCIRCAHSGYCTDQPMPSVIYY